jgi:LCP family protein required for cell wall assembly
MNEQQELERKHSKLRGWWFWLGAIGLGVVAGAVVYRFGGATARVIPQIIGDKLGLATYTPFQGRELTHILLMGMDGKPTEKGRTDTMMIVTVNRKDKDSPKISILSIPRDSKIEFPDGQINKLNTAFGRVGLLEAKRMISEYAGVPIDYYALTNFKGIRRIVDAVGGIDIYVDRRMRYTDRSQNLYIRLEPGFQHLDGEKAEQFLRFRHEARGDLARVERQQRFLQAVGDKMQSWTGLVHLPEILRGLGDAVTTDLDVQDIVWMANLKRHIAADKIKTATLPSVPVMSHGVSYVEKDSPEAVKLVVDELCYGILPPAKIEVLNGTTRSGIAKTAAAYLERYGFVVERVDNAEKQDYAHSEIHSYRGHLEKAKEAASLLGAAKVLTVEDRKKRSVDFTVIVGQDWVPPAGGDRS